MSHRKKRKPVPYHQKVAKLHKLNMYELRTLSVRFELKEFTQAMEKIIGENRVAHLSELVKYTQGTYLPLLQAKKLRDYRHNWQLNIDAVVKYLPTGVDYPHELGWTLKNMSFDEVFRVNTGFKVDFGDGEEDWQGITVKWLDEMDKFFKGLEEAGEFIANDFECQRADLVMTCETWVLKENPTEKFINKLVGG